MAEKIEGKKTTFVSGKEKKLYEVDFILVLSPHKKRFVLHFSE